MIDPEVKAAMLKYEELKILVREAEAKMEELQPVIFPFMKEHRDNKIATELGGYFEYKERPVWKYSPVAEKMKAELTQLQKKEIAENIATKSFTAFFEYKSAKKDDDVEGL